MAAGPRQALGTVPYVCPDYIPQGLKQPSTASHEIALALQHVIARMNLNFLNHSAG